MSLHIFSRRRSCHELGVCQRTAPQCRRACHIAKEEPGDAPPIGYEAARAGNVLPLRAEYEAALRAEKLSRGLPASEEERDRPTDIWATMSRAFNIAAASAALLALLAAVYLMAVNPQAALADLQQIWATTLDSLRAIYWAAIHTSS